MLVLRVLFAGTHSSVFWIQWNWCNK